MKNITVFSFLVSLVFYINLFSVSNTPYAATLISLKTEYFSPANVNFRKIYASGAIFGIGGRFENDARLMWGVELEHFSRIGEPVDWLRANSKMGLLIKGPNLEDKVHVKWSAESTSTDLTIVSFMSTLTYKLMRHRVISPAVSLKMGVTAAKEKFSGKYEYEGSDGWKRFKDEGSSLGLLAGANGGIEFFRGPFRIFLFCGYNYLPCWSDLGYRNLGGFNIGGQILFTFE